MQFFTLVFILTTFFQSFVFQSGYIDEEVTASIWIKSKRKQIIKVFFECKVEKCQKLVLKGEARLFKPSVNAVT
jgi:hypothetical protein